jgi:endonuclease/exonuclease/phosphatase family metal-dependent hydrolase
MHTRLSVALRLAMLAAICATAFIAADPTAAQINPGTRPVKVMTRNLYPGADITRVLGATTPAELAQVVTDVFTMVQSTDFPARAQVLAREIRDADPMLIGLQEVSLWRTGPLGSPTPQATTVAYDFLQILQTELAALGLQYTVVRVQSGFDAEAPSTLGYAVRLTQRNAILAKAGVPANELMLSNANDGLYRAYLPDPILGDAGGTIADRRGWISVDAIATGRKLRFINTHLDSTVPGIRAAQAAELLEPTGPVMTALDQRPVILVGDLNSAPNEGAPSAYTDLIAGGFLDTWIQANGSAPGFTWGYAENLRDPTPTLRTRIDHVLARPAPNGPSVGVSRSQLVGIDPANRTPSGLWPSDHAGIVTTLTP